MYPTTLGLFIFTKHQADQLDLSEIFLLTLCEKKFQEYTIIHACEQL